MLADQAGRCAICGTTRPSPRWVLDHDHACHRRGEWCGDCVRGVLCGNCNVGLGMFGESEDTLLNAVIYVRENAKNRRG